MYQNRLAENILPDMFYPRNIKRPCLWPAQEDLGIETWAPDPQRHATPISVDTEDGVFPCFSGLTRIVLETHKHHETS